MSTKRKNRQRLLSARQWPHSTTKHLLKVLNKKTAFVFIKKKKKIIIKIIQTSFAKNVAVLVHACPSRMSKSTGKGFLSLGLRSGSHPSEKLVVDKVSKFHFHSITAKGQFTNHTFHFGMHILRY